LKHLYAITDFVLSRAGANAIFELLTLQIPMLLIPLSLQASRGDQIENAKSFFNKGIAHVLFEENLTADNLYNALNHLKTERQLLRENMQAYRTAESREKVISLIVKMAK